MTLLTAGIPKQISVQRILSEIKRVIHDDKRANSLREHDQTYLYTEQQDLKMFREKINWKNCKKMQKQPQLRSEILTHIPNNQQDPDTEINRL